MPVCEDFLTEKADIKLSYIYQHRETNKKFVTILKIIFEFVLEYYYEQIKKLYIGISVFIYRLLYVYWRADYIQNNIENSDHYYFTTDSNKDNFFDLVKDSYTTTMKEYQDSLDLLVEISNWYRNVVLGG